MYNFFFFDKASRPVCHIDFDNGCPFLLVHWTCTISNKYFACSGFLKILSSCQNTMVRVWRGQWMSPSLYWEMSADIVTLIIGAAVMSIQTQEGQTPGQALLEYCSKFLKLVYSWSEQCSVCIRGAVAGTEAQATEWRHEAGNCTMRERGRNGDLKWRGECH